MDNASKNASDMISRLTMQYNRGRQAAITNELVDIITGTWRRVYGVKSCLIWCDVQVPVRSKCDVGWPGRHRVLGRRLLHVVVVHITLMVLSAMSFGVCSRTYGTVNVHGCICDLEHPKVLELSYQSWAVT